MEMRGVPTSLEVPDLVLEIPCIKHGELSRSLVFQRLAGGRPRRREEVFSREFGQMPERRRRVKGSSIVFGLLWETGDWRMPAGWACLSRFRRGGSSLFPGMGLN
ncbi:hypothetical protein Cadr_000025759 [Camelus dromedarius]|uniref:Uncharacterized protein n=1 Tax=Camelus dromedarius TaxID=9838 RepID=A0A5N4CMI4_CAMDR|nr:hypothetical protein Cadr_000025759 [Camelus dromedarius]